MFIFSCQGKPAKRAKKETLSEPEDESDFDEGTPPASDNSEDEVFGSVCQLL